jgi:hypothetical protein
MRRNLKVGICPVADPEQIELEVIAMLKPPLNIKGWANPIAGRLRALRRLCADEARRARGKPSH